MKTRHLFRDYEPGDICTGLVLTRNLNTSRLVDMGIIAVSTAANGSQHYVFRGFGKQVER